MEKIRARHFLLTFNNPELTLGQLEEKLKSSDQLSAYSAQLEKGKEGTPHFQIYLGFKKQVRPTAITALLGSEKYHAEIARNPQKSFNYCCKEESRIEGPVKSHDKFPGKNQGKRTDLEEAAELVKTEGALAVAREMPGTYIRYHRGLKELEAALKQDPKEKRPKRTIYIWGEPGTGKTTFAKDKWGAFPLEYTPGGFFNYSGGQKAVLLDEIDVKLQRGLPLDLLFSMCDPWPTELNVKGGWVTFNPEVIIMTSNYPPEQTFVGFHSNAAMRRLSEVIHWKGFGGSEVDSNSRINPLLQISIGEESE